MFFRFITSLFDFNFEATNLNINLLSLKYIKNRELRTIFERMGKDIKEIASSVS